MWTFSKKFAKKNWFGQELRNLYKFKVFIMNQSTTLISRTAARWSVCAATHAVMPLGPTCRRQKGFCFWRETSAVSPPNSQQLCPPQRHWHIGPSSQGPQASDVKRVPPCPRVVHSVVHSCSCFFWILNENYKNVKICHLYLKSGVFFLNY